MDLNATSSQLTSNESSGPAEDDISEDHHPLPGHLPIRVPSALPGAGGILSVTTAVVTAVSPAEIARASPDRTGPAAPQPARPVSGRTAGRRRHRGFADRPSQPSSPDEERSGDAGRTGGADRLPVDNGASSLVSSQVLSVDAGNSTVGQSTTGNTNVDNQEDHSQHMATLERRDSVGPYCAICLQTCVHPVQLPCQHIFCFLCAKGAAKNSKRCAMCRSDLPADYLENPRLLNEAQLEREMALSDGFQWFYEGRNGWWKYDERTSAELESAYGAGQKRAELLVAGYRYVVDFEAMLQLRRSDPTRRRRVKRDLASVPKKGVAGIRLGGQPPPPAPAPAPADAADAVDPTAGIEVALERLHLSEEAPEPAAAGPEQEPARWSLHLDSEEDAL